MLMNAFQATFGRRALRDPSAPRRGFVALLLAWTDRARERRALAELDPRQLGDVGLTRADIGGELAKHTWHR